MMFKAKGRFSGVEIVWRDGELECEPEVKKQIEDLAALVEKTDCGVFLYGQYVGSRKLLGSLLTAFALINSIEPIDIIDGDKPQFSVWKKTVAKMFSELVEKFNPYHDAKGRFTTGGNASFMTIRTKDPSKQKWADMAVARAKEAEKKKNGDFVGQIASVKAESDKIKGQIANLAKEEEACVKKVQQLKSEQRNARWKVRDFEVEEVMYDKKKMENFDADAAQKRMEELRAEEKNLEAESSMWYRDRPERGTPEYDEWRKYRDEHDINEINNKRNAIYDELGVIRQDVRNYEKYKAHEKGRADYEKQKARMADIDGEVATLDAQRLKIQKDMSELAAQNEVNVKKAGKLVADAVEKAKSGKVAEKQARLQETDKELEKLNDEFRALRARRENGEINDDEFWSEAGNNSRAKTQLMTERNALRQDIETAKSEALKGELGKVRSMGVSEEQSKQMKTHMPGRSTVKQSVRDAYENYPTDWIEQSMQRGAITTKKVDRGYYSDDQGLIAISGWDKASQYETAVHELGHRMEKAVPGILQAEKAFYERRTAGESVQRLKDATGISYRADETTRKDNFLDAYMGKDYAGQFYELVSMGFEYAYTKPDKLAQDPDYQQFIYGLLAIG